jgi:hypothetical protein
VGHLTVVSTEYRSDPKPTRASVPERIVVGTIGISVAVLGFDWAAEHEGSLGLVWLAVGLLGLLMTIASVRGTVPSFRKIARLLRLPPMA